MKEIGEKIKELRMASGLKQLQLAQMCGFDGGVKGGQTRISNYELGNRDVSVRDLITISKALDKPLTDFLPDGAVTSEAGPTFNISALNEPNQTYSHHVPSKHALKLISVIKELDAQDKLPKSVAESVITLMKLT